MKSKFSTAWLSSKLPRKQRKYRYNAPLHLRHKFLNSHLSAELRKKYGKRKFPIRKGDEVLIMRGSFAKKKAKVGNVDLKKSRVTLENINRQKKDGTKINVYFDPSNLRIESLFLEDKERIKSLGIKEIKKEKGENKEIKEIKKEKGENKEIKNVPNKN